MTLTNIPSLGRSGLADWLIQRLSAVVLAAYTLFLGGVFLLYPDLDYPQWRALFTHLGMRLFSLLSLLALCAHAWIGIWTITTDYLNGQGPLATALRLLVQGLCALLTLGYLLWGISILW